jgi:hypothetical protein
MLVRWEYDIEFLWRLELQPTLAKRGNKGWEIIYVGVLESGINAKYEVWFKRQRTDNKWKGDY